jgi:uncharacterized protein (UPF0261 family)
VQTGSGRRIVRHPFHINHPAFAEVIQHEIRAVTNTQNSQTWRFN